MNIPAVGTRDLQATATVYKRYNKYFMWIELRTEYNIAQSIPTRHLYAVLII